ncbi:hypothetical protein HYW21_00400 [Candidatus Woesearchaeota archaeon]|nr:hypothetical protein [Candidatus Woesearchaeota archaeon]
MTSATSVSGIAIACQRIQKVSRILRRMQEQSCAKSRLVVRKANLLLDIAPSGFFSWVVRRKQRMSDKEQIFKETEEELQTLGTSLELQKKYLVADFHGGNEEKTLSRVLNIPIIRHCVTSNEERMLLEQVVYKHKDAVQRVPALFLIYTRKVIEQGTATRLFLSQLREIEVRLHGQKFYFRYAVLEEARKRELVACIKAFEEHFKPFARIHPLEAASDLLEAMVHEAARIAAENREVEQLFNQQDLEELRQLAGQQAKREQNKIIFFRKKLAELRRLRLQWRPEQLIAVHVTNYFPENGMIKPTGQFTIQLPKSKRDVKYPRESIHFCLNGKVTGHDAGDAWKNAKIAVLVPVNLMMKRIVNLNPADTYVVGELRLPKGSEILARSEDAQGHNFGEAAFIPVPLEKSLEDMILLRIKERGFTSMRIGSWSWNGTTDEDFLKEYKAVVETEEESLLLEVGKELISGDEYRERMRPVFALLHLLEKPLELGTDDDNFYRLSQEFNLEWVTHRSSTWRQIEVFVESTYNEELYGSQLLEEDDLNYCKDQIKKYAAFLREKRKRLSSPEEREAIVRIAVILGNLNKGLIKKYHAQREIATSKRAA